MSKIRNWRLASFNLPSRLYVKDGVGVADEVTVGVGDDVPLVNTELGTGMSVTVGPTASIRGATTMEEGGVGRVLLLLLPGAASTTSMTVTMPVMLATRINSHLGGRLRLSGGSGTVARVGIRAPPFMRK